MRSPRILLVLLAASSMAVPPPTPYSARPSVRAALRRITADSLRGRLSFLSSDLLEGRDTPSRGLDIAAEYIAASFRGAGLEPKGDDGYFQTATLRAFAAAEGETELTLEDGSRKAVLKLTGKSIYSEKAVQLNRAPVLWVRAANAAETVGKLTPADVREKVAVVEVPGQGQGSAIQAVYRISAMRPALLILLRRDPSMPFRPPAGPVVINPEAPGSRPTTLWLSQPEAFQFFDEASTPTVTLSLPAPVETGRKVRNVVGLLPGSDPVLKNTYVLITAHYDHVGLANEGDDRVYNGANDDGSGTVSVLEIAQALSSMRPRPRRSILFVTYFGEEKGLWGSRYFGKHPVVPLSQMVGDLNLEQLGRTDSSEGPQIATLFLTGRDFTTIRQTLRQAGRQTGVTLAANDPNSDDFFNRSDNQALADQGIPAHTICVAYEFADYHKTGDEWQKIDFANLEKVDRTLALTALMLADDPRAPQWNTANPKTARYAEAAKKLREAVPEPTSGK